MLIPKNKYKFRLSQETLLTTGFADTGLRHRTTSRSFEKGLNPVEVATITGHKDPRMLMRYTHLRAENLARKLG